jgi:uncharacterized membrane protein SpoIIM required for sporulation
MDLDAYTAAHRDEWDRLAQLGKQRHFSGDEADELIDRYQSGASQLSAIRSSAGESAQGDRLSLYLSMARMRFTGTSANVLSRLPDFFLRQIPAALYRLRWSTLVVAGASIVIALLYFAWAVNDPRVLDSMLSQAEQNAYVNEEFINYYSNYAEGSFFAQVWTNNARIAALCVAFGIFGVTVPYLMFSTFSQLGYSAALFQEAGKLDQFLLYIAPHGQLELYSIFVAGAAGLAIFWSWISPGPRTRGQALAAAGRSLFTVAVGLTLSLLLSGIVEGYVTRQPWPWAIKIGIGSFALASFLAYQWILGRWAYRQGETGDLDEFEAGATRIVAG